MINTLQNLPERVPSKGGNKLKKAVALAIALTLSGEPTEAKTYEKQEFPTEMLASIPGEYTPMTKNVEQATVPNYINQAQNGVKKYYPQYEEYFKPIFNDVNGLKQKHKNLINNGIKENFEIFEEELINEKDKITTILLTLEKLIVGKKQFEKNINGTEKGRGLIEIAGEISDEITRQSEINQKQAQQQREQAQQQREQAQQQREQAQQQREQAQQQHNIIKMRNNKLEEIINYINSNEINKKTMEMITEKMEEYFSLFEIHEIKKEKGLQEIIKRYITYTKKINKQPSNTGQKFIEEYNNIKTNK